MHGYERRVRPVEKTRGKAVMLCDGEPVPDGVLGAGIAAGVFAEIPQQVAFEPFIGAQPDQAGLQVEYRAAEPAKREVRAEAPQVLFPRPFVHSLDQLVVAFDAYV